MNDDIEGKIVIKDDTGSILYVVGMVSERLYGSVCFCRAIRLHDMNLGMYTFRSDTDHLYDLQV